MILRHVLLWLSRRPALRHWVESSPVSRRLTSRFIAGQRLEGAIAVSRRLNRMGLLVTLDYLGEQVGSRDLARASRDTYLEVLGEIQRLRLDATVSVKLSQFGLDISEALCHEHLEAVVSEAARLATSVEVDMESYDYVDRTLHLVVRMHEKHGNLRGVIQAYLRRSEGDLEMLCQRGIPVRLCKGAYSEPPARAFPRKSEVNWNFLRLARILLDRGIYPGFATHDERILAEIRRYAHQQGIPSDRYEFQMLYGIRRDLERRFLEDGYRLRLYVPFGEAWYPYFMRRLAERPANLLFLLKNLVRG